MLPLNQSRVKTNLVARVVESPSSATSTTCSRKKYGVVPSGPDAGKPVFEYCLAPADASITAKIITYGATVTELHTPDRFSAMGDVVLGFTDLSGWTSPANHCFNATIGRTAGRNSSTGIVVDGKRWGGPSEPGNNIYKFSRSKKFSSN